MHIIEKCSCNSTTTSNPLYDRWILHFPAQDSAFWTFGMEWNSPWLTVQLMGCVRVFRCACGSKMATSGNLSDSEVINPLIFGIKRLMDDDYTINSCVTFQIYAKNQCSSFTRYSNDALQVRWASLHVSCPEFSSLYNSEGILKIG